MKKIRSIALLLAAVLLFSGVPLCPRAMQEENAAAESSAAESGFLFGDEQAGLYWEEAEQRLTFRSGAQSVPLTRTDIGALTGTAKNEARSLLLVQYADASNTRFWANSYTSCMKPGTFSLRRTAEGAELTLDFSKEKEQFSAVLRFSLQGGQLSVSLPLDQIREYGETRVLKLRVLPAMLGGLPADEGYVILPDGSGMAIAYDNTVKGEYSAPVYGADAALTKRTSVGRQETACLPLIGAVNGSSAVAAYVADGDAQAIVSAKTGDGITTAAFEAEYRQMDTTVLADSAWNEREIYRISDRPAADLFTVRYAVLTGDRAQPAGVAAVYRQHLEDLGYFRRADSGTPMVFAAFGAVKKQKTFLGIPYTGTVTTTSLRQLPQMVEAFAAAGVDSSVWGLYGFLKGGMYATDPSVMKLDRAVGGMSDLRSLVRTADEHGAQILPASDLSRAWRTSLFSRFSCVKKLDGAYARVYAFKRNLGTPDKARYHLLSGLAAIEKNTDRALRSLGAETDGLLLGGLGDTIYADHGSADTTRGRFAAAAQACVEKAAQAGGAWVDGGSVYALRAASGAVNVPDSSSGYDFESFALPLYTMVFAGRLPISGTPLWAEAGTRTDELRLKALATGMLPCVAVTAEDPVVYQNTALDMLIGTQYEQRIAAAAEIYAEFCRIRRPLAGMTITGFARTDAVWCVTYENGTTLYANFSSAEQTVGTSVIPPLTCIEAQKEG